MNQTRIQSLGRGFTRQNLVYAAIGAALLFSVGLAIRAASGGAAPSSSAAPGAVVGIPSFNRDVEPLLERACVRCHGADQADKGLRLDSYRSTLAGDSYGAVLIPGKSSLSAIISVVKYGTMPHDGVKLPQNEIDTISRWIDAGAPEN